MHYEGGTPLPRPWVAHVEAGLRSRDRMMPEEVNRAVADAISDVLFTTCREADGNLLAEGVPAHRICFVGNPMIDSLLSRLDAARACPLLDRLGLRGRRFGLCTLHRPSNVDRSTVLSEILAALDEIAGDGPVLLPLHPRTRGRIEAFGLASHLTWLDGTARRVPERGLVAVEPLAYLEMLSALTAAAFVLTDSGGIQEETTALGVPCVTMRDNTERPVTIDEGTNVLAGTSRRGIVAGLRVPARPRALGRPCRRAHRRHPRRARARREAGRPHRLRGGGRRGGNGVSDEQHDRRLPVLARARVRAHTAGGALGHPLARARQAL
jgi:UDP-N-acetylglucosamine 2-epimerase (non-hydrolysing)